MPSIVPPGPISQIDLGNGQQAPLFILPFDKNGICTGPQTRKALLEEIKNGDYSDIFLFSHGWNNDWPTATNRYFDFFDKFRQVRTGAGATPPGYKPILVGIFWPSTLLVFGEDRGPSIAGGAAGGAVGEVGAEDSLTQSALIDALYEIAAELPEAHRERFYALASADASSRAEARELAEIMLPLYREHQDTTENGAQGGAPFDGSDSEGSNFEDTDFDADDLVELWSQIPDAAAEAAADEEEDEDGDSFGGIGMGAPAAPGDPDDGPQAAGILGRIIGLPRQAIRGFSVWKMKDRAGVVGSKGVSPLLRDLIVANGEVSTHLIGHSFGAKVVMSAVASGTPLADKAIESMLLLQPAVNFWCFAKDVDGLGFPGGYHDVPRALRQPLIMTFSKQDVALRRTFHLAVTRKKKDLGEVKIAGPLNPTRYGGLGGWGPQGMQSPSTKIVPMPPQGQPFPPLDGSDAQQILALDGSSDVVKGHGDVATLHTAWALWHQVVEGLS